MKVLHLSSERSWRGGEQQIAYLIEELETLGVENFVACRKKSAFEKYCVTNNINHISLSFANEFDFLTAWDIRSFCREFSIDIVHMHSGHSHAIGVWSSIFGNQARLILSRRVDFPIKNNIFSKFKYNFSKIERVICVSEAIKKITQTGLSKPDKCIVIHSGIDVNKFQNSKRIFHLHEEFNIPKDKKIVANISAIAPHKDYFTFVDTVEELHKKGTNAHYFIIGDGPDRKEVEQYIKSKNLQKHISLTGFRTDISRIIKDIDVLLITSKTEGLGTTILDAFANEIPVVATKAGGIPEAVINQKTGLLSNVGDSQNLAKQVISILENDTLKNQLVVAAREHLTQNFTKETTAKKTLEIYKTRI